MNEAQRQPGSIEAAPANIMVIFTCMKCR